MPGIRDPPGRRKPQTRKHPGRQCAAFHLPGGAVGIEAGVDGTPLAGPTSWSRGMPHAAGHVAALSGPVQVGH